MRYASWQSRLESSGVPKVCRCLWRCWVWVNRRAGIVSNRRRGGHELQMPEAVFDDLCRRDGCADAQRLLVAKRTGCHAAER
jgi:hypothetical protein